MTQAVVEVRKIATRAGKPPARLHAGQAWDTTPASNIGMNVHRTNIRNGLVGRPVMG
jgi:hypothetical protein